MPIYLLTRIGDMSWDENRGFVIRAKTKQLAREYAADEAGYEGKGTWLSDQTSKCEEVPLDGAEGIILNDFRAS